MKTSLIILIAAFIFSSCKKQDSNPVTSASTQETVTDYFPLQIGDYWIYQVYTADTSLVFTATNTYDTLRVEQDTLLNGINYKVFNGGLSISGLWRDSADYIVNELGEKLFTINNTSDFLLNEYSQKSDSLFYNTSVVLSYDSACAVPAGNFAAKYVIGTLTATKPSPTWMMKRNYYYAFSEGVGLIRSRLVYAGGPAYMEERLIRWHLNTGQTN